MRDSELFQAALALEPPWAVVDCLFDAAEKRLDIRLDFPRGSSFACPTCGAAGCHAYDTHAYDTKEKTWRHLNFFQRR